MRRRHSTPVREAYQPHYRAQVLARAQSAALTTRPFAERLVHFWSNHFAVSADKGVVYRPRRHAGERGHPAACQRPIRRPVDGGGAAPRDDRVSRQSVFGGQGFRGWRRASRREPRGAELAAQPKREFGINENLAREILELHTLGVNGGYTQADVTSFAQIITGWSIGGGKGRLAGGVPGRFYFRDNLHEPGAESLPRQDLYRARPAAGRGRACRSGAPSRDGATSSPPSWCGISSPTIRRPPPWIASRVPFSKSGGDLPQVYAALIESPEAWDADARKFKTPEDFVFSTLAGPERVAAHSPKRCMRSFDLLGQRQYTPGSPAGWPDTSKSWDGSDALMHRVLWASRVGSRV